MPRAEPRVHQGDEQERVDAAAPGGVQRRAGHAEHARGEGPRRERGVQRRGHAGALRVVPGGEGVRRGARGGGGGSHDQGQRRRDSVQGGAQEREETHQGSNREGAG